MQIGKFGYLWLGTDGGGVDFFDGKQFINIKPDHGLSHSRIVSLLVTDQHSVICGIRQHFFSIIKRDTIINFDFVEKYGNTSVTAIAQDSSGKVWLGNDQGDVFTLVGDSAVSLAFSVSSPVKSLLFSSMGVLYVATDKGLFFKQDTVIDSVPLFEKQTVNHLAINTYGTLWIATNKGVACYEKNVWAWEKHFNEKVSSNITKIVPVHPSEIWFSTYGSGVVRWDRKKHFFLNEQNGLPNLFCTTIVRDPSGNIWIGTDGGGLIKYGGNQFLHYFKSDKPYFETIMAISQDKTGNYWLGSFGNGIVIIDKDGKSREFEGNKHLPSKVVYSIEHLPDGRILVGSKYANVAVIEKDNKRVRVFNTSGNETIFGAVTIKTDGFGRTWFGTANNGLYIIQNQKVLHLYSEIPSKKIESMLLSDDNTVWVGTEDAGVFSLNHRQIDAYFSSKNSHKEKFEYVQVPYLKKNLICGIDYDLHQNLWIGTFGTGLFCQKPDGSYLQFTTANGMLSNNIYSVLSEKNGSVWVGSDRGVHQVQFHQSTNEPYIVAYGMDQGFMGLECNLNALFSDSKGQIWIGNISGVSVFNPNATLLHSKNVSLHLTAVFTSNDEQNTIYPVYKQLKEGLILPYHNNNLTFHYKAVDLNLPSNVMYSYQMENLDAKWITSKSTGAATYSFIPPGKYIFRVKATNGEGRWSNTEIAIPVVVEPPFWQTFWFIVIIITCLTALFIIYFRYRQLALIRRNKLLKELIESRTIELQIETMRVQQQGEELRTQAENLSIINTELKKLSIVASKTDNAVLIANKDFEWEWVNEGFTKMYGYSFDEYVEMHGRTIQQSSSCKKIEHVIEEALENKKSVVYSSRTLNSMGKELWVQSTLTPIYDDDDGELQMFVVIDVDITHIKQINNELRKLSLVASKTDNAVIIMNKHGEIEWVNEGFHRMYELSLEEFKNLYGTTIFELHRDARSLKRIQELYETDQTQSFVSKFVTSKGNEKWIQTVLTPIISPGLKYEQLIAVESDITRIKETEEQLTIQKENADMLLKNILPEETAEELKSKGYATPRYYKSVTVLFADVKNFSSFCQNLSPQQLLNELHEYFNEFDEIVKQNFVEKIKTVGDAYMCAGGLPIPNRSHPFNVILVGLQIQQKTAEINLRKRAEGRQAWEFRVGIHTGDIISGVIGKQKFAYDIWGDTVNIASRMEFSCETGKLNISGAAYQLVKDYFDCDYRGKIDIKNRGKFDMYFVNGIKPDYSVRGDGITPNEQFKLFLAEL
jgi:PAS domain S-box-containing protein